MANQPETATYEAGIFQLELDTPVQGGVGGASNTPLLQLANRTAWLKGQVDSLNTTIALKANSANPTFTGTVTIPTAGVGDDTTKAASTAFVQAAMGGVVGVNVAGSSNVTLTAAQWGVAIIVLSGALTGNINVIFPTRGDQWIVVNNTTGAFTITAKTAAGAGVLVTQGKVRAVLCDGTDIKGLTDFDSIALTGVPTVPTAAPGTSTTQAASTAFVQAATGSAFGAETTKASAGTCDLGTAGSRLVNVTGTTGITSFGSSADVANPVYVVRFTGALLLTHHATSMILPGGANITTAAGDYLLAQYMGSGNWRILAYQRGSALLLAAALASNAEAQTGADATKAVTPAALASVTATLTRAGLVELATDVEAQGKTDASRALTPANLAALGATTAAAGLVELATLAEAQAGTDSTRAVTPEGLAAALGGAALPDASTTVKGKVELATDAETITGTDTVRAVTPASLAAALASIVPQATTTAQGKVELATNAEAQTGTDTDRAVTPAALASVTATATRAGLVELATDAEVATGTDTARAVTPAGLVSRTASETAVGLVELATTAEVVTGSDTSRAVTPAGVSAALTALLSTMFPWASVVGRTSNGGCTVLRQRNIASITRTGTGLYSVSFTTPMGGADYGVLFGFADNTTPNIVGTITSQDANGFTIRFQGGNANQNSSPQDPALFNVHVDY